MELVLTVLSLWGAVSLALAAVWTAVKLGLPLEVPTALPQVSLPQPRAEHVDVDDPVDVTPAADGARAEPAVAGQ